jgi:L-fuconolactonase
MTSSDRPLAPGTGDGAIDKIPASAVPRPESPVPSPESRPVDIDAHQHFWKYSEAQYSWIDRNMGRLKRDFLPADLRPEIARTRVAATIAVQACQTVEETRWLLELADAHSFVAGVIGWVDLCADDVTARLAELAKHPKLVGVRHVVQAEPDDRFLLRDDFCRGVAELRQFGLVYDILIYPRHLAVAADFVAKFERQPFVLDHLAKPEIRDGAIDRWARDLRRLAECPHVSCKISGLVTEADWDRWTPADLRPYLDVAFECFGSDRLIAGSDWPVCTLAAEYSQWWTILRDYVAGRPASERDSILGGNARRVWGLPVPAGPGSARER